MGCNRPSLLICVYVNDVCLRDDRPYIPPQDLHITAAGGPAADTCVAAAGQLPRVWADCDLHPELPGKCYGCCFHLFMWFFNFKFGFVCFVFSIKCRVQFVTPVTAHTSSVQLEPTMIMSRYKCTCRQAWLVVMPVNVDAEAACIWHEYSPEDTTQKQGSYYYTSTR